MSVGSNYLRRRQAAEYLVENYGFGAERTLAKFIGGGPLFRSAGRLALYERAHLDALARDKIGPLRKSTSDTPVSASNTETSVTNKGAL
jgi:hypothetical protein